MTLKLPFIEPACGSHTNRYLPSRSLTFQTVRPVAVTEVARLKPGPLSRKLWMFDLSWITILYRPDGSVLTALPFFLSVIVKPGPTTPFKVTTFDAAVAEPVTITAHVTARASRSPKDRRMKLLSIGGPKADTHGRAVRFSSAAACILAAVAQGYPEGWSVAAGALEREFRFGDFAEAMAFVNRVADLAEAENHHPDISIHWNTVVLRFWTHSQDAITERDRELAALAGALA